MTNRQWLESLSDEEFVDKLFYLFVTSGICEHVPDKECDEYYGCQECRLAWLQAEHKEDTND